jgi:hypothetical protein
MATVAEPVATRISTASNQPSSRGELEFCRQRNDFLGDAGFNQDAVKTTTGTHQQVMAAVGPGIHW